MTPPVELPASLGDGRIRLRPLEKADIDAYVAAFAEDPEIGVMLGIEQDPTTEELRARLKRRDRSATAAMDWVIADGATDELLGELRLLKLDWHSLRGEIGLWLARGARGQGYASAATALVIDLAFGHLGLERLEMTTIPENQALCRLAERLGFRREGVLRSRNLERGRRVDVVFYGLLRQEWAAG